MVLMWAAVAVLAFALGSLAEYYGLPAPHLFAAAIVGLVVSLGGLSRAKLPSLLYKAAQAVTGVVVGAYLNLSALGAVGAHWLPVLGVTLITLVLSIAGGVALSHVSGLDKATASLGMVAGGSAGIVAASDELGADARLVAFMQYLRLLVVVLAAPLLVRFVLSPSGTYEALGPKEVESAAGLWGYLLTPVLAAFGVWAGTRLKIPLGTLLVPLVLTAGVASVGSSLGAFAGNVDDVAPEAFREVAFMLIGLEVGLRFTPEAFRRAGGLWREMLGFVLALVVITGLLAWGLSAITGLRPLDAYLATTPGGINAILATSFASGANTSFVFAVQALRLGLMVLVAPPVVRWLVGRGRRSGRVA